MYLSSPNGSPPPRRRPGSPSTYPLHTPSRSITLTAFILVSIYLYHSWTSSTPSADPLQSYIHSQSHQDSSDTRQLLSVNDAFLQKDGLLYLADKARPGANPDVKVVHPILHLMQGAKKQWEEKVKAQSRTLEQAVNTYRRKYGRAPPKGFDKWFKFAQDNKVILVDDYDQINRDILPFLGMPPSLLRSRSSTIISDPNNNIQKGSFTLHVVDGRIGSMEEGGITGGAKKSKRANEQIMLLKPFVGWLPDMNITISEQDGPGLHLGGERRLQLETLAREGRVLSKDQYNIGRGLVEFTGWQAMCPPDSAHRNAIAGIQPYSTIPDPSFITDTYSTSDFCQHPLNEHLHSFTNNYGIGPWPSDLWPLFSHSKAPIYGDILVCPLSQYGRSNGYDPEWEDKSQNKILWRGSVTGARHSRGVLWRGSQRERLNLLTNSASDTILKTVYTTSLTDNTTLTSFTAPLSSLNPRYFDISFVGGPFQCSKDDGTCESMARHLPFTKQEMTFDQANEYKYVIDIDGNGWSGRFDRLMRSNSAVLKSSGFVEWWSDRVQPWLHYIPLKLDYTDLHSIASFFIGDEHSSGHDDLGREIGTAGKEWTLNHWRLEDMQAYMFRLYLEYARVMLRDDDDLSSMEFTL